MAGIKVEVTGLDELVAKYEAVRRMAPRYMAQAAQEAIENEILPVRGVKNYPPETEANKPHMKTVTIKGRTFQARASYYVRGIGTQVPVRGDGYRSLGNSKRYGTQYYIKQIPYGAIVGNSAPYGIYVGGAKQAGFMARIGWRRYIDVAQANLPRIRNVFIAWLDKLMSDAGLE